MGFLDIFSPAGAFLEDKLNEKGEPIKLTPDKTEGQLAVANDLQSYIQKYLSQYQPGKEYTGQRTAGTTSQEQQGLGILTKYLDSPNIGNLGQAATKQIMDTLNGSFDPNTSAYYNATKAASNANLEDQIQQAQRAAAARGSFSSTGALRDENDLRQNNLLYLNQVLGQLAENERGRQFAAAPVAAGLEESQNAETRAKVGASQQYGGLNRIIEQSDLEAKYQDFLRKQQELGTLPNQAQGFFGTPITFGTKEIPTQTGFQKLLDQTLELTGQVLGGAGKAAAAGAGGG